MRIKLQGVSSSSSNDHKWWLYLWNLNISPKIKIFLWRVCLDALPTLSNLFKRKVSASPCCKRCSVEEESVAHALFWCSKSKSVWQDSMFGGLVADLKVCSGFDIVRWLSCQSTREDFEFLCILLWNLWFDRNLSMHNGKLSSSADILEKSLAFLREFQDTQRAFKVLELLCVITVGIFWLLFLCVFLAPFQLKWVRLWPSEKAFC
ncbi:hypothetical protein ACOSP7_017695 [Xanthoceras sorbifolium]